MKIVSAAEMREIDRATSERFGVPSITLMENAGSAVARFVLSDYPQAERVAIVCGKGNNGGGGVVVAPQPLVRGPAGAGFFFCGSPKLSRGSAGNLQQMLGTPPAANNS